VRDFNSLILEKGNRLRSCVQWFHAARLLYVVIEKSIEKTVSFFCRRFYLWTRALICPW